MAESELDAVDREWLRSYENQLLAELYVAYLEARGGGKRKTVDEQKFEVDEILNVKRLARELLAKTYEPSGGEAHVIKYPVRREIFAAPFRDRVVHHWIYDKIYDWWDRHFLYDSYSCRIGKGTLFGIQRLERMMGRASKNFTDEVYIVKLDLQGYFMSINRKKLYDRVIWGLNRQYAKKKHLKEYEILKYAIRATIFDDPVRKARLRGYPEKWKELPKSKSLLSQPSGVGIVIGNLTSQLFSNVFLDQLDRYLKFDLKYKYTGRYVDDFFIILTKDEMKRLGQNLEAIKEFLRRNGLTLHPNKIYIQKMEKGVQFLGGVAYPRRVYASSRLKKNYKKAVFEYVKGFRDVESLVSYHGHVMHLTHFELEKQIFNEVGWEVRFRAENEGTEQTWAP